MHIDTTILGSAQLGRCVLLHISRSTRSGISWLTSPVRLSELMLTEQVNRPSLHVGRVDEPYAHRSTVAKSDLYTHVYRCISARHCFPAAALSSWHLPFASYALAPNCTRYLLRLPPFSQVPARVSPTVSSDSRDLEAVVGIAINSYCNRACLFRTWSVWDHPASLY